MLKEVTKLTDSTGRMWKVETTEVFSKEIILPRKVLWKRDTHRYSAVNKRSLMLTVLTRSKRNSKRKTGYHLCV